MRRSLIYINASMFYRRSEYKGFNKSLQIAFSNNVLVSQFCGWSLVCSIDVYIPRCLIIDCFYGPQYVSHPPFLERSAKLWAHWLRASTTASYTLVYLLIFIDYCGEFEMADASWYMTYLERPNRESTHLWSARHSTKEGRSQQSSLGFKATWTRSACWRQSWFWQGKEGVFLHYHCEILTKRML